MSVKTYDASQVSVIVGTRRLSGLAEGSFVTVSRDEQAFTKQVGADGEVTRAKTNNKAGSITITLQQASSGNDYLSTLAKTDEETSAGVVPVTVVDGSGTTVAIAESGWIQKLPDTEFGRDAGEREWVIDCADLEMLVGGNA